MKRSILVGLSALILGGAVFGASGCYAASAGVGVDVAPPEPAGVYYDARPGSVWIDGHWAWTDAGWQWYPGYWVAERPGYVYVQGYWDTWGGHYYWRPGVWSPYRSGYVWLGGRWTPYQRGYHHYDYRTHTWVRGGGRYGVPVRDHRSYYNRGGYRHPPPGRHYNPGPYRDHRHHH